MAGISEQQLLGALATIARAQADGGVSKMPGADHAPEGGGTDPSSAVAAMDGEAREILDEAAQAIAFVAFVSRGGNGESNQALTCRHGAHGVACGGGAAPSHRMSPDILAEDGRVEAEIERAGEAIDRESRRDTTAGAIAAAMEARLLGTAITLAGCTLSEGMDGQAAVRACAAHCLTGLAAELMAMAAAGAATSNLPTAVSGDRQADGSKRP